MKVPFFFFRTGFLIFIYIVAVRPNIVNAGETDEYDRFAIAKNAFDAGDYQEAVKRFETLLKDGLQNPTLVVETLKLLGVSQLFIGNRKEAEDQFTKLLTKVPDYSLDPLMYPIEVVDFFTEIKQRNQKQLDELAKATALEEAEKKAAEEARKKVEYEKMKRNVYLEQKITTRSLLVAVLPFGAGQFQNRHMIKGWAFFSSELLLSTSATVFYFLHSSLRDRAARAFDDPNEKDMYIAREKAFRLVNHISLITLGVTAVAGIVDSLYYFKKQTVEWKSIEEKDVPLRLRPSPTGARWSLAVEADNHYFGLGFSRDF
jgi:tetratricopeptide (TPR) repeat protein